MVSASVYKPEIDGLRAVAVISVVIFHFFPSLLPGGFVGVDIFFVISGYLITGIILREMASGPFSIANFYDRRIRRIFPALITVLAATLLVGWFLLLPGEYMELGRHAAASAVFFSNILLWSETGYFDTSAHSKILLHLWSLAIEEQFYLLWPAVLYFFSRLKLPLVTLTLTLITVSFAVCLVATRLDPSHAFFAPWSRAWELMVGALLAALERNQTVCRNRQAAGVAGLILIGIAIFAFEGSDPFPGWRAILPVIGAVLIISAGPSTWSGRLLSLRPMPAIGLISYPLYLWHWPILVFPYIVVGATPSTDIRAFGLVLAVALSIATYRWIERPVRSRKSSWTMVAAMASLAGTCLFWIASDGMPGRSSIAAYASLDARFRADTTWSYAENENCLKRYPASERQEGWWFCILEEDRAPSIFIIGNSFANHLYPGLANSSILDGQNVLQFGVCDPAMGIRYSLYSAGHPCQGERRDRQELLTNKIVQSEPDIQVAVLSALWPSFTAEGETQHPHKPGTTDGVYSSVEARPEENSYTAFMAGLEKRIVFLLEQDIMPIVVLGTPTFPYSPETCFALRPLRDSVNSCSVALEDEMRMQRLFRQGVDEIVARHPETLVFDPLPLFCSSGICQMQRDGRTLLRDVGHLSEAGSKIVGDALAAFILKNVALLSPFATPATN